MNVHVADVESVCGDTQLYAGVAWYAVYTQPHKERYAAIWLRQLGLEVFLPEIQRYTYDEWHSAPLFPRYLFVAADLSLVPPSQINRVPGVRWLVNIDEQPLQVPPMVIDELQRRVQQLNAGPNIAPQLQPGSAVRIIDGPLLGLEAVFVGRNTADQRITVLLELLGRANKITLPRQALIPTNQSGASRGRRLTRGGGRRVKQG